MWIRLKGEDFRSGGRLFSIYPLGHTVYSRPIKTLDLGNPDCDRRRIFWIDPLAY